MFSTIVVGGYAIQLLQLHDLGKLQRRCSTVCTVVEKVETRYFLSGNVTTLMSKRFLKKVVSRSQEKSPHGVRGIQRPDTSEGFVYC